MSRVLCISGFRSAALNQMLKEREGWQVSTALTPQVTDLVVHQATSTLCEPSGCKCEVTDKVKEAMRRGNIRVIPLSVFLRSDMGMTNEEASILEANTDLQYQVHFAGKVFEKKEDGSLPRPDIAYAAIDYFKKSVGLDLQMEREGMLIASSIASDYARLKAKHTKELQLQRISAVTGGCIGGSKRMKKFGSVSRANDEHVCKHAVEAPESSDSGTICSRFLDLLLSTSPCDLIWILLWISLSLLAFFLGSGLFARKSSQGEISTHSYNSILVARGSAASSYVSMFLVFLPLLKHFPRMVNTLMNSCRKIVKTTGNGDYQVSTGKATGVPQQFTTEQEGFIQRVIKGFVLTVISPLEKRILFHQLCGITVVLLGWTHAICWLVAVGQMKNLTRDQYEQSPLIRGKIPFPVTYLGLLRTTAGWSGVVMLVCLTLPLLFLTSWGRRKYHSLFIMTHHLYLVFAVIFALHGIQCVFSSTWFGWLVLPPLFFYAIEKLMRHCDPWQQRRRGRLVRAEIKTTGFKNGQRTTTLVLYVSKGKHSVFSNPKICVPGMYVYLNFPGLSRKSWEWHPFTMTSAPQDRLLRFHVQVTGDWTRSLHAVILREIKRARKREMCVGNNSGESRDAHPQQTQSHQDNGAPTPVSFQSSQGSDIAVNMYPHKDETASKSFPLPTPAFAFQSFQGKSTRQEEAYARLSALERLDGDKQVIKIADMSGDFDPTVNLDGPFGSPSTTFNQYGTVLVVGTGVGVTPLISILRARIHSLNEENMEERCSNRRLYLVWCTRSRMSLQWFRSEFERLEALDKHGRVSISLFLTSAKDPMEMEGQRISRDGTMFNVFRNPKSDSSSRTTRKYLEDIVRKTKENTGIDILSHSSSLTSGVQTRLGYPNWEKEFQNISRDCRDGERIGVLFCGNRVLRKELEALCRHFNSKTLCHFEFHAENF